MATLTYTTVDAVQDRVDETGYIEWNDLTREEKSKSIYLANKDIETFHGQDRDTDGNLWEYDNANIQLAASYHALHVGVYLKERIMQTKAAIKSDETYTEGRAKVEIKAKFDLEQNAENILLQEMKSLGINNNQLSRTGGVLLHDYDKNRDWGTNLNDFRNPY